MITIYLFSFQCRLQRVSLLKINGRGSKIIFFLVGQYIEPQFYFLETINIAPRRRRVLIY